MNDLLNENGVAFLTPVLKLKVQTTKKQCSTFNVLHCLNY